MRFYRTFPLIFLLISITTLKVNAQMNMTETETVEPEISDPLTSSTDSSNEPMEAAAQAIYQPQLQQPQQPQQQQQQQPKQNYNKHNDKPKAETAKLMNTVPLAYLRPQNNSQPSSPPPSSTSPSTTSNQTTSTLIPANQTPSPTQTASPSIESSASILLCSSSLISAFLMSLLL